MLLCRISQYFIFSTQNFPIFQMVKPLECLYSLIYFHGGYIPLFFAAEVGNVSVCKELLTQHTEQQLSAQREVRYFT